MKVELELIDDNLDRIIIAELKQSLECVNADPTEENSDRLKNALETVLKYYGA